MKIEEVELEDTEGLLRKLNLDRSVPPVSDLFKGGTFQAIKRFDGFVRHRLKYYDQHSNQPQTNDISHMGPYLHFGQISPLYLALKMNRAPDSLKAVKDAYITEVSFERMVEASDFIPFSQVPVPIELRYRLQTLRNACTSRDNKCHQK